MSKIKALVTALILGTSSLAAADTGLSFHASASWGTPSMTAPVVRDHRTTAPSYYHPPIAPIVRGTWISLAEPMNLARGRTFIDLNNRAALNQIRLQSTSGQAFVSTVTVNYVGGARQVVTLNQWIDSRNPLAQFNLNRTTQVDSMLINGSRSQRGGKFQVFGYASSTRPTPPIYQPERPVYQPPVYHAPAPVVLASAVNFARTDGYRTLSVNTSARFNTLRLSGVSGQTFISKIEVQFANGQTQSLRGLNRSLLPGQTLDLALNGMSGISQLIVFTNDTLTPVENHITGEFTVSAL